MSYGLHIDGKPPFSGVAMLVETLHVAGGNGEYVYPSDDARYGYFATFTYSDNHFGHTALRTGSGGDTVDCTRALDYGGGLRWNTASGYAYNATGSVDTVFVWRYKK